MTHIQQIDSLFVILITLFETQIKTIRVLGQNSLRPVMLDHTELLAKALMRSIIRIEQQALTQIKEERKHPLSHSERDEVEHLNQAVVHFTVMKKEIAVILMRVKNM
jgi:hypothetical protein